jgi:hypothetical protein
MRLAKAEQHCWTSSDTVLCCHQSTDIRRSSASHYHTWVATIASAGRTRTQTRWKLQSLCRALMSSSATAMPHSATKHAAFEQHCLIYSRDTCRQRLEDTRRLQQERARARVRLPVCPASFALALTHSCTDSGLGCVTSRRAVCGRPACRCTGDATQCCWCRYLLIVV